MKKTGCVAILDAGAQYAKVIDRRVRELCVESHILNLNTPAKELVGYSALIISGGPQSVYGEQAPKYDPELFSLGIPIFGICYGMQLINYVYGGKVEKKETREDGVFAINIVDATSSLLYRSLPAHIDVLLTHGDSASEIAPGFTVSATTLHGIVASIENAEKRIYGVQYHPEVDLTPDGNVLFQNFLTLIAGLTPSFTLTSRLDSVVQEIRAQVGETNKVLCLLSGGVDSSVCAALLKHAIGADRIFAIHVDNGFMRQEESAKVERFLSVIGLKVTVIHGAEDFYNATTTVNGEQTLPLKQTLNPEHKRKIIGDAFMTVSQRAIESFQLDPSTTLLAQGTLRPDLIESASSLVSKNADVIKTHHNDTQLVRALRAQGRIIEPLKDYHKDEVRALGKELGLPDELVWRQPFPGPGLAIRILCADQAYLTNNDAHIVEQLKAYHTEHISCTLLPCRTVGVQGDQRSYSSLVALSCDNDADPDWVRLFDIAKDIPKRVHGVNRVVFAFGARCTNASFTTITPTRLTPDVIAQLQAADEVVNQVLLKHALIKKLSQVPVILFPVDFGVSGQRSICIRTFITNDFMTGVPAWPGKTVPLAAVREMVDGVLASVPGIVRVCFDLTSKPPATTEWE